MLPTRSVKRPWPRVAPTALPRRVAWSLAGCVAVVLAWPSSRAVAQLSDFAWTLGGDPGGSGFVTSDLLHITGPDDSTVDGVPPGVTHFTTTASLSGTVHCTYAFDNQDTGLSPWHFEHPVYLMDGQTIPLDDGHTSFDAIFDLTFHVDAGQSFGFGIKSVDCSYGPGVADITDFVFTKDPGIWTDLGHALRATVDFTGSFDVTAPAAATGAGLVVCGCGDVDADGVPDLAEGRPEDGHVRVLSGASQSLIQEWTRPGQFGAAVAALGDIDGDGHDDLIVGAPSDTAGGLDAGRAYVLSGLTGAEIYVLTGVAGDALGTSVAGGISVDLDDVPDFLVGLPRPPGVKGQAYTYKGVDGTIRYTHKPPAGFLGDAFGAVVASTEPYPGGSGDAVIADPAYDGGRGRVYVFSIVTGGLMHTLTGASPGAGFGLAVAGAGNLDGNSYADFVIGAPFDLVDGVPKGSVSVYSKSYFGIAELLAVHVGEEAGDAFGAAVAGGRDVDFDGLADVVIGAPGHAAGAGRLVVRNGMDGTLHADVEGAPGVSLGASVAMLGPIDANGASAVAAGMPQPSGGATHVLHDVVGTEGPPHLEGAGTQHDQAPASLSITLGAPNAPAWLIIGQSQVDLPLKGGVLVPAPDLLLFTLTDGVGGILLDFAWPAGLPPFFEIRYQAWIQDAQGVAGFTATNGLLSQGPPVP